MQHPQTKRFLGLQEQGPDAWLAALRPFEEGAPYEELFLELIFHNAGFKANKESDLGWAEVAIRAAEVRSPHLPGNSGEFARFRAMKMRARYICLMGARPKHPVLDKETVLEWVRERVHGSPSGLPAMKARFREIAKAAAKSKDPGEVREATVLGNELFSIKWRLLVARDLAERGELPSDPEIRAWLEIPGPII